MWHIFLATHGRLRASVPLTLLRLSFSPSLALSLSHTLSRSACVRTFCVVQVWLTGMAPDLDTAAAILDLDHTKAAQNATTNLMSPNHHSGGGGGSGRNGSDFGIILVGLGAYGARLENMMSS